LRANTFDLADIDPLGPVATARQMCKGDVFVSVDPGEELLKVSLLYMCACIKYICNYT
jgi:hypothetical protein